MKILIIDDHDEFRNTLKLFLEQLFLNYIVLVASNEKEGLLIVQKEMPEVVLVDLMMQEIDGIQTSKAIKKQNPSCHIVLISLLKEEEIRNAIPPEIDLFIEKGRLEKELPIVLNLWLTEEVVK